MQGEFWKNFPGGGRRGPAGSRRRRPVPAGPVRARAQGVGAPRCPAEPAGRAPREGGGSAALLSSAPRDISSSAVRRFSLSECGPPCAGLLLHRRRSHYWCRSRFRPLGHFKTMPDYGAQPRPAVHALHLTKYTSLLPAVLFPLIPACSVVPGLAP